MYQVGEYWQVGEHNTLHTPPYKWEDGAPVHGGVGKTEAHHLLGLRSSDNSDASPAGVRQSSDGRDASIDESNAGSCSSDEEQDPVDPWRLENYDASVYDYPGCVDVPQHCGQKPVPPTLKKVTVSTHDLEQYVKLGTVEIPVKVGL